MKNRHELFKLWPQEAVAMIEELEEQVSAQNEQLDVAEEEKDRLQRRNHELESRLNGHTCEDGGEMSADRITNLRLVSSNQESLFQSLMSNIRAEIMKPEYDKMYISTLIGVLGMLKTEMYERERNDK